MTLGEFVQRYIDEHDGMSVSAFASMVDMSRQQIGNIIRGVGNNGKPMTSNMGTYKKIAEGIGMSEKDFLMMLNDDMLVNPSDSTLNGVVSMPSMRSIPLLGTIACGEPILAAENIEDAVDMPAHIRADFALRCKGDSMINARIYDGDIVYIRQQPTVEDGQIAAVLIDDEATLKRVRLFSDHIVLEPENPQFRPLVFWEHDMDQVRILGLAVAFTSTVR